VTTYAEEITASRRLTILLALYFANAFTMNRAVLRDQVGRTGYVTSMDEMMADLEWLVSIDLIEMLEMDVVRLTYRGEDIALGRSQVNGVRRPSPAVTPGKPAAKPLSLI
jgi:serine protease inhibitor